MFVAWRKVFDGNIRDVVVAASRDGGVTWGAPVKVHDDGWFFEGCPHAGPDLAVDTDDRVHVTWHTGSPNGPGSYYAISTDGARSFGNRQVLGTARPPSQAKLIADPMGNTWLAWEGRTTDGAFIRTGRIDDGGNVREFRGGEEVGRSSSMAQHVATRAVAWLGTSEVIEV